MMHCPKCGSVANTRSSRYMSDKVKERYHQCRNIVCSTTFVSHEQIARIINKPQLVEPIQVEDIKCTL